MELALDVWPSHIFVHFSLRPFDYGDAHIPRRFTATSSGATDKTKKSNPKIIIMIKVWFHGAYTTVSNLIKSDRKVITLAPPKSNWMEEHEHSTIHRYFVFIIIHVDECVVCLLKHVCLLLHTPSPGYVSNRQLLLDWRLLLAGIAIGIMYMTQKNK